MKSALLTFLVMVTFSAQAATVLNCTTPGDALSEVRVVEDSRGEGSIVITKMDQSKMKLAVSGSINKIKYGSAGTLIAAKDLDAAKGGEIQNAAMLQILSGQSAANLALDGSVFFLNCKR